jgi:NitT/TauT family transport system permease protein
VESTGCPMEFSGRSNMGRPDTVARDRLLSLLGFVAVWWVGAQMATSPTLLPGPQRVAIFAWHECVSGALPSAFAATLSRVVVAFVLAMVGGGAIGYLAGRSRRANAWIDPWVVIALNLPVLVVIVLAYIWIGLNDAAAILAVVLAKAPTVVVTLREGTRALDSGLAEMARAFDLPLSRRLRFVVFPQLLPYIAAAGRSGLSITWKIVLLVELLGRPSGVGYALNLFFQNFNVTGILAYGLAFAGLMLMFEAAILQPLERRATAWRTSA